jgi:guanine deaminase
MRFGSGLAHIRPMLDRGINVGIATDAANSSDNLNMFEATRLASFVSRILTPDYRRWLRPEEVLEMATAGSARATGYGDQNGRLLPGYKADIVLLKLDHLNYVPRGDVVNQVVFTENGGAMDSVMVGGKLLMQEGRLLTIDEARLFRDAQRAAERLVAANAERRHFSAKLEETVGQFCIGLCREPYHVHRLGAATGEQP